MRILHLINTLEYGGAEFLVTWLIRESVRRGEDAAVAVLRRCGSDLEREMERAGRLRSLDAGGSYSPRCAIALRKLILQSNWDVIHVHLFPSQLWASVVGPARRRSVPLVTTEHSTLNRRRRPVLRPLDRWMYRRFAAVACISVATAESLRAWVPEIERRITVIPNGVDLEAIVDAVPVDRRDLVPGCRGAVVLCVGRFEAPKDYATVLRAMTGVPEAHLLLVGDGPDRPAMQALAERLGLQGRAHFAGRRRDVPGILKAADVFVQSSNWEGFGIAALEAMAAGVPVVASRVPGLAQLVEGAGLTFEPGDDAGLAACINLLLSDVAQRKELARKGVERAAEYSIGRTAERYLALYKSVLGRTAPSLAG